MNTILARIFEILKITLLVLVVISFSTDTRLQGALFIDINPRISFQVYELFVLPLFIILIGSRLLQGSQVFMVKEDVFIVLFVAWAVLVSWSAFDPLHALSRAKDFFSAWVLYAAVRSISREHVRLLMLLSASCAVTWSLYGIVQMLNIDPWFGSDLGTHFTVDVSWKTVVNPISGDVIDSGFAQGIYLYPQNFSYYLVVPFFMVAWLKTKHRGWIFPFILVLAAIIGSGSKTFILLSMLVALWHAYRRIGKLGIFTTITMCCCSVLAVILAGAIFLSTRNIMDSFGTFIWRIEQWSDTLRMLTDIPEVLVTGHGTEYLKGGYSRFDYPNPHNSLLYFLIEYGVVGLFLFIGFLLANATVIRARFLQAPSSAMTESGASWLQGAERYLLYGLAFTLGMTATDDFFVQTQMSAMFFFYLGLLVNLCRDESTASGTALQESINEPKGALPGSTVAVPQPSNETSW